MDLRIGDWVACLYIGGLKERINCEADRLYYSYLIARRRWEKLT